MFIYPTETIYGLGVNVLDEAALGQLVALKGRDERQTVSWLVRDLSDIKRYAEVSEVAERIIATLLPGPLTIVLPAKETVPKAARASDETIGFRISADPIAKQLIAAFMETHDAPLTCTSANVSGMSPQATVALIREQFVAGGRAEALNNVEVYDDGPRQGAASTIVRVVGGEVQVLREGEISQSAIINAISNITN